MGNDEENVSENAEGDNEKDLQKSLDENLDKLNTLMKSKKKLSKKEVEEMMKDKENKKLFKEYMKDGEEEDDDEEEEEDKKVKKSFDEIEDNHGEVIDAIPVLKSFLDAITEVAKKINKIEGKVETLVKSFDDDAEIRKSVNDVISSQSALIKSINEDIKVIGNQPLKVKGKITQQDLIKSDLDNDNLSLKKSVTISTIKNVLMKSFQDNEITAGLISKWEMSGYNMNVFSKNQLALIESKLK
jgi:hypothetical protein